MAHWIIDTGFGALIISERLLLMGLVMVMFAALVVAVGVFEQRKNRPRRHRKEDNNEGSH